MNSAQEEQNAQQARTEQAARDPRRGDGSLRQRRLRTHEVGRHRGRHRRRRDRAVSLLRVQAALPVRDHGRGHRGLPFAVRARSPPHERDLSRALGDGAGELLRAVRARGAAQPRARRGAGPALDPSTLRARGTGTPGRAVAHARAGVRVGELPRRGDARRDDPGDRSAPAHARRARALQQHLALVPARTGSSRSIASPSTTRSWRTPLVGLPPQAIAPERAAA